MSNTHPLHDLAEAIRAKHMEANTTAQRAVMLAVEAGQLLIEAKGQVEHGEWSDWLSQNCQFSERTARTYMSLARRLPGLDDEKRQRVAVLPLRQAIKELSAPRVHEHTYYFPPQHVMAALLEVGIDPTEYIIEAKVADDAPKQCWDDLWLDILRVIKAIAYTCLRRLEGYGSDAVNEVRDRFRGMWSKADQLEFDFRARNLL